MTRHTPDQMSIPSLEQLEPRRLLSATIPSLSATGLQSLVEVGQAVVGSTPTDILLHRTFANPVVFVTRIWGEDADPAVARISNVQADQFTVHLIESPIRDGVHSDEILTFLVVEAGLWRTPEGTFVEAGVINTSDTVGSAVTPEWTTVAYQRAFPGAPMLLTQVQTNNDVDVNHAYVTTREQGRDRVGFQMAMEHAESITTVHASEGVGYLAMSRGTGTWSGRAFQSLLVVDRVGSSWQRINYTGAGFTANPLVFADLGSTNDSDPGHLRLKRRLTTDIIVRTEEDKVGDVEITHAVESVDLMAVQGTGLLRLNRFSPPTARRVFRGDYFNAWVMNPTLVGSTEELIAFDLYIQNTTGNTDFNPDAFDSGSFDYTGITGQLHQQYGPTIGSPTSPTAEDPFATVLDSHFLFDATDVVASLIAPTEDVGVSPSTEPGDAVSPFDTHIVTSFGSAMTGLFAVNNGLAGATWQLVHLVVPRGSAVTFDFAPAGVGGQEHIDVSFIA